MQIDALSRHVGRGALNLPSDEQHRPDVANHGPSLASACPIAKNNAWAAQNPGAGPKLSAFQWRGVPVQHSGFFRWARVAVRDGVDTIAAPLGAERAEK